MPRKLDIQAEESVVNSPLRRSSRINVTTPSTSSSSKNLQTLIETPESKGAKTRRVLLSQENADKDDKKENKPAPRGRRGSVTKEETDVKPEPAKPRTRRASAGAEPSTKVEEPKSIPKRRRSSAAEEVPEPDTVRTLRSRRGSLTDKPEEDITEKKHVKGRRTSTEDISGEEVIKRPVRSRRNSAQSEETNQEVEKEKKKPTRGRRASTDKLEDEPEAKNVRLTPSKSKRRLSITENVISLEPIEEQELEIKGRKSNSPQTMDLQVILNTISPKNEATDCHNSDNIRITRSTPVKSKRRLSITENAVNLESIRENELEKCRKSQSPLQSELRVVLTSPDNKDEVKKEELIQSKISKPNLSSKKQLSTTEVNSNLDQAQSEQLQNNNSDPIVLDHKVPNQNKSNELESEVSVESDTSVSVAENAENFTHVEEQTVVYSPKSERKAVILTPSKKTKYGDIKTNLDLSVIEENSFVDETIQEVDNDKHSPRHSPKPKRDVKTSPETSIKSPRLMEHNSKSMQEDSKIDDPINLRSETSKISPKMCTKDDKTENTNSEEIDIGTSELDELKVSKNDENVQELISDVEESKNKSVEKPETVNTSKQDNSNTVVMKQDAEGTNLKGDFPDISVGSDGSFRFNLNVSIPSTNSQNVSQNSDIDEADDANTSKNSNSSNKENVESNINTELQQTSEDVDDLIDNNKNVNQELPEVPVNRISNVFRPKMKENSFMEPMEVDEISYIQDTTICKLPEELKSTTKNVPAAKSTPIATRKSIQPEKKDDMKLGEQENDVIENMAPEEEDSIEESFQLNLSVTRMDEVEFNAVNSKVECSIIDDTHSEQCAVKCQVGIGIMNETPISEDCSSANTETVTAENQPSESTLDTKCNSNTKESCNDHITSIVEEQSEQDKFQLQDKEKAKETVTNSVLEDVEKQKGNNDKEENMLLGAYSKDKNDMKDGTFLEENVTPIIEKQCEQDIPQLQDVINEKAKETEAKGVLGDLENQKEKGDSEENMSFDTNYKAKIVEENVTPIIEEQFEQGTPQLQGVIKEKEKESEANNVLEDLKNKKGNSDTEESMSHDTYCSEKNVEDILDTKSQSIESKVCSSKEDKVENMEAQNSQIINESITSSPSHNAESINLTPLTSHSQQFDLSSKVAGDNNPENSTLQTVDKPELKNVIQDKSPTLEKNINENIREQDNLYEVEKSPTYDETTSKTKTKSLQITENEGTQNDTVPEELKFHQHQQQIDISDNVDEEFVSPNAGKLDASDEYEFDIPSEEDDEKAQELRSDKSDNEHNSFEEKQVKVTSPSKEIEVSPKTKQSNVLQVDEGMGPRIEETEVLSSNLEIEQKQSSASTDEFTTISSVDDMKLDHKRLDTNAKHKRSSEILPLNEEAILEKAQNSEKELENENTSLDQPDSHLEREASNHILGKVEFRDCKTDECSNNEVSSQMMIDADVPEISSVENMINDFKDVSKENSDIDEADDANTSKNSNNSNKEIIESNMIDKQINTELQQTSEDVDNDLKEKSKTQTHAECFNEDTKVGTNDIENNIPNNSDSSEEVIVAVQKNSISTNGPKKLPKKTKITSEYKNKSEVEEAPTEKSPITKGSNNDKTVINKQSKNKRSFEDHKKSSQKIKSPSTDKRKLKSNVLEHFANTALDEYILKQFSEIEDKEPSDDETSDLEEDSEHLEEESDQEKNEFISTMAEEGEEDTPSEGSNDIIDEGESINSTESEIDSDDDYDENDSFICDEEQAELLSGEEYDLGDGINPKEKKSRIIQLDDFDDDVIKIKRKAKQPTPPKKKRTRIITITDSSDTEEEKDTELEETKESSITVVEPISPTSKPTHSADIESLEIQEIDDEEILEEEEAEAGPSAESPDVFITNEREDGDQFCKNKRKSSITIHENINVSEIRDAALSERISNLVDTFCTSIRKGEISMNLSLECEVKDSSEESRQTSEDLDMESPKKHISSSSSDDVFESEDEIPKKKSQKRKQKKGKSTGRKRIKTDESGSSQEDSSRKRSDRLSVTLDDLEKPGGSEKKLSKKRRLSKSLENLNEKIPKKKKKGKTDLVSKKKIVGSKISKKQKNRSSEEDLRTQTYSIMDQVITDVKNRPMRTILPSKTTIDMNGTWITEIADVRPSTTAASRRERTEYKTLAKIHPKDFRSQMLYDSSRVKRVDTKTLLRKKGAYF